MTPVTCTESNDMRPGLRPISSLTNYVGGEVLDPRLPARTETTWGTDDGVEVLRERTRHRRFGCSTRQPN